MRAHIIENGIVVNTIIVEDLTFMPGLIDGDQGGKIGDLWDGETFSIPAPPLPKLEDYDTALTAHLDAVAQSRRYADRVSCAVRAGYEGPFQAEGVAFATWMDACNAIGYQMLEQYQLGQIPQPTIDEMLAALPEMIWPV